MTRFSPLASVAATREVLERHGLSTRKSLGQHFLVNDAVVGKILTLSEVDAGDAVLEVGPGIGTLTCALLDAGARVVAIERDEALPAVLAQTCATWEEHFEVLQADALDVHAQDLPDTVGGKPFAPAKFVANLPYAVAATLVLAYFERFETTQSATVMVQSEVADRMAATPGSKDYGAYTVKLALYAQAKERFKVAPGSFFPPPRVDSAVIRLDRVEHAGVSDEERACAAQMADAAFANRRKTLANSCKAHFASRPEVLAVLPEVFAGAGVDPSVRGETLTLEDFLALGRGLCAALHAGNPR